MSAFLEESPLTDSKMDISEATLSLDSTGVSPLAEDEEEEEHRPLQPFITAAQRSSAPPHHNHNHHDTPADTQNEDDLTPLDNQSGRPEALLPPRTPNKTIQRTLANSSHPLMSPGGTDSDSESHARLAHQPGLDKQCHNFPDLIPRTERLPPTPTSAPPAVSPHRAVSARNALNQMRGKAAHQKLALLRAASPDLLSSESEADLSQYHATVEANFQAVSLIPNAANGGPIKRDARRPKRTTTRAGDDITSLDSISNHSFENDEEHNLASLSPSSSLIDGLDEEEDDEDEGEDDEDDDDDDEDCEGPELMPDDGAEDEEDILGATTPTPQTRMSRTGSVTLPQYSAAEERRDSRNWQKITLPDGRIREIDMRVIEPYKRVLSHGGYLKAGGQNAIVIFCACHLPDKSRADYNYVMDNLFLYVVKTLDQLVTEDYVLIYLHGGTSRRNVPPFPWLKKCYQLLDRRLRKSLKNMYLVHPTFWIKSIVWMTRPFVSAKFWRKLVYVKSLEELSGHVAVEKAAIPEKVKQYDAKHH